MLLDISLLGLLIDKRIGAITYHLIHHKAVGLGAYILGNVVGFPILFLAGMLFDHSSFDRMLGLQLMDINSQSRPALGSIC